MIVDASAILDLLQPPSEEVRDQLAAQLPSTSTLWLAPDVLSFEVLAVARRRALRGDWPAAVAERVVGDYLRLPVQLIDSRRLLQRSWQLRNNLTATDGLYIGLAQAAGEPLLTTDRRLARAASTLGIETRT